LNNGVIGLFDSGVGGLTVAVEVYRQLPGEATVYFGDTAHVPYGHRSVSELLKLAGRIVAFLIAQGAKFIICACNTSSSVSLPVLVNTVKVPMLGLIKPAAWEALRLTASGKVGVLATEATVKSGAYERELKKLDPAVCVYSQAAPRLVPLVEAGEIKTPAAAAAVKEYLAPLKKAGIDTLILGCTHYPFLSELIAEELGPGVCLVDPAGAAVRLAAEEIKRLGLLNNNDERSVQHKFFVSGDPLAFKARAASFLGYDIGCVEHVDL